MAGVAVLLGPLVALGACAGQGGSTSASRAEAEVDASAVVTPAPSAEPDSSGMPGPSVAPEPEEAEPSATSKPAKDAAWAARGMKRVGIPAGVEPWYWYDSFGPFLHAVSADEVWVTGEESLYRYTDGQWHDAEAGSDCLAHAGDGALWTTALDGSVKEYPGGGHLFRTTGTSSHTVTDVPVLCGYGASTFAGPQGSVWVLQDDEVVRVQPDGRRTSIGRPERVDADLGSDYDSDRVCLHGVDPAGAVWVTEISDVDDEECTAGTWHSWNGQKWQTGAGPDPFTSAHEKVVAGRGIGWTITLDPEGPARITRFKNGRKQVVAEEPGLASLTAAPDAGACALAYPSSDSIDATAIVCFDAHGETGRVDVSGLEIQGVSVAPDGAIWVAGPQVARLGRMSDLS